MNFQDQILKQRNTCVSHKGEPPNDATHPCVPSGSRLHTSCSQVALPIRALRLTFYLSLSSELPYTYIYYRVSVLYIGLYIVQFIVHNKKYYMIK